MAYIHIIRVLAPVLLMALFPVRPVSSRPR